HAHVVVALYAYSRLRLHVPAPPDPYPLSLHDALPIFAQAQRLFERNLVERIGRQFDAVGDHARAVRLDLDADVRVHHALVRDEDLHLVGAPGAEIWTPAAGRRAEPRDSTRPLPYGRVCGSAVAARVGVGGGGVGGIGLSAGPGGGRHAEAGGVHAQAEQ